MDDFRENDDLYRCITPLNWKKSENRPSSTAFDQTNLSVDWCRYCSPEDTKTRRNIEGSGVAAFTVKFAVSQNQEVKWDPLEENKAHTLVIGKKRKAARNFAVSCRMIIPCLTADQIG